MSAVGTKKARLEDPNSFNHVPGLILPGALMYNGVSAASVEFAIDQLRHCQFGESPVHND